MEPASPSSRGDHESGGNSLSRRLFQLAGVLAMLLIGLVAYALTKGGNEASLNPIAQAAV